MRQALLEQVSLKDQNSSDLPFQISDKPTSGCEKPTIMMAKSCELYYASYLEPECVRIWNATGIVHTHILMHSPLPLER